ncbi:hypothetical protein MAPG_08208 [Magnaporthiopsis poae ATCC 64411]|uniref:Uncharacterized protein n=1 Tax=Magnaporthiopsis poae (strain ATCC 64411 / 73-15) TaxID=644358 RepID=A0A0C4E6R2_MAGP6|nr:hypothetical protein MAPG_08208 [Magnaporthiopsis poae ATCC 64411]
MEEALGHLLANIVWRCFLSLLVIGIDKFVIPRRDAIVRLGRRVQDHLRLPGFACIFSEADPGILERHLRTSCLLALITCIYLSLGLLVVVLERPQHPVAWIFALGVPLSALMGIWAWLACAKRRIDRGNARDTESGSLIVRNTNTEGRRGTDEKTATVAVDSEKQNLLATAAAANNGTLAVPTPGPSSGISAAAGEQLHIIWSDPYIC